MNSNKQTRKEDGSDSYPDEDLQYGENMSCPYMNTRPLMFHMTQYSQFNRNSSGLMLKNINSEGFYYVKTKKTPGAWIHIHLSIS